MSAGASNLDHTTHPLLGALSTVNPAKTSYTYRFAEAGEAVNKGSYSGGDNFTRAWSSDEKDSFYAVVALYEAVAGLTFTEVTVGGDLDLQIVNNVPGGWAGYAAYGGSTFVVGSDDHALLTHELGHSLWLDHPFEGTALPGVSSTYDPGDNGFNSEYYTVMAYRTGEVAEYSEIDFVNPHSLGVFDIAALQAMYGANQTFNTGNDSYGISDLFETIWDAGGRDAIDFSAAQSDGIVDLRAATLLQQPGGGGWASVADLNGSDVGGYVIAYGVVIENGFSGAGNDTVRGNAADNLLRAGLGDDTVYGGAGQDTLEGAEQNARIQTLDLIEMNTGAITNRSLTADNFAMPGSVTVDIVVRFDTGTTHAQRILSYDPDGSGNVVLELQLWNDSSPYLYGIVTTGGGGFSTMWTGITKSELTDGEVHRLTLSREAATGTYRFYLDGELRNSEVHRAGEALESGGALAFGQSQGLWGGAGNPDYAMKGDFGAIAIYDQILGDAEIAARQISDLANPTDARLVNYWAPTSSAGGMQALGGSAALTTVNAGAVTTMVLIGDDDRLFGEAGDDLAHGYVGNDSLEGGAGADTLNGGDGNDTVLGGDGADVLRGNDGSDFVEGGDGADFANGGKQHDEINGDGGNDHLEGANGMDTIRGGDGDDLIFGGKSNDVIHGGNDNDTIRGNVGKDALFGDQGADSLMGGNQNDTLRGAIGDDTLLGQNGFDQLSGDDGNDLLDGGNAGDTIDGGAGNDTLLGGFGKDSLVGGANSDTLNGGDNNDTLTGGAGNDTFVFTDGWDHDVLTDFSSHDAEDIDLSGVGSITDFTDLVANHIRDNGGGAEIYHGSGNSILLQGVTVAQIGVGLDYSESDFVF